MIQPEFGAGILDFVFEPANARNGWNADVRRNGRGEKQMSVPRWITPSGAVVI